MGMVHDTGWDAAYDHEGYPVGVRDDGSEVADGTRAVARLSGWRAGCECGWRSARLHAATEWAPAPEGGSPATAPDALYDGPITTEWRVHLHQALPELAVHDYAAALAQLSDDLAGAVSTARGRGLSWDRIGRAAGMSRQAAWERWGR